MVINLDKNLRTKHSLKTYDIDHSGRFVNLINDHVYGYYDKDSDEEILKSVVYDVCIDICKCYRYASWAFVKYFERLMNSVKDKFSNSFKFINLEYNPGFLGKYASGFIMSKLREGNKINGDINRGFTESYLVDNDNNVITFSQGLRVYIDGYYNMPCSYILNYKYNGKVEHLIITVLYLKYIEKVCPPFFEKLTEEKYFRIKETLKSAGMDSYTNCIQYNTYSESIL